MRSLTPVTPIRTTSRPPTGNGSANGYPPAGLPHGQVAAPAAASMVVRPEPGLAPAAGRLRVKIFADGADLAGMIEMARKPYIAGLTTNPTLMRKAGVTDY